MAYLAVAVLIDDADQILLVFSAEFDPQPTQPIQQLIFGEHAVPVRIETFKRLVQLLATAIELLTELSTNFRGEGLHNAAEGQHVHVRASTHGEETGRDVIHVMQLYRRVAQALPEPGCEPVLALLSGRSLQTQQG